MLYRRLAPGSAKRWAALADMSDVKHVFSAERLPFSLAYFGSLGLTLFFAIGIRSTIGTIVAAIIQVSYCVSCAEAHNIWLTIQVGALLSYVAAYFPGGMTTLRFGGQMLLRGAGNVLPI